MPFIRLFLVALAVGSLAPAADSDRFFEAEVRPVLAKNCYACHSSSAKSVFAELRLDSRAAVLKGGHSGPAVIEGEPDASKLIEAVRYESDGLRMPPTGKLSDEAIAALEEWVRQGAPWPEAPESAAAPEPISEGPDPRLQHWAFQPVAAPQPPTVQDAAWPASPIDRFLLARLDQEKLQPAADADRATWLRRVTFDLTGLPPEPGALEAFLNDSSAQAHETVVDRLLGSAEFGERWARHWLDLSGYADNIGLGRRIPSRDTWRYRDWLVQAFNDDKPYDEFVREQVAGDVLPYKDDADRREKVIATGFLAIGPWALVDSDKEQLTMDVVDHQIDTVGRGLLGLTLGCARCHDHKFDPVPTRDYYAMAGIFRSTATLDGRMTGVFSDVLRTPLPETPLELRDRAEALDRWQRDRAAAEAALKKAEAARDAIPDDSKDEVAKAAKAVGAAKKELDRIDFLKPEPPMALALQDYDVPADTAIRLGGSPHAHGEVVPRGFLTAATVGEPPRIANRYELGGAVHASSGRRELARWLTDPKNPLPARVMANRIWHHLFGAGLVASVDNFGLRGDMPTHPELLDWLAARFVEQGWSMKSLIREVVLSRAYRISAEHNEQAAAQDPENRLLWRANRRRLEAEAYRDAVLAVSGKLDRRRGGFTLPIGISGNVTYASPPIIRAEAQLGPDLAYRRTVYLPTLRKSQLDELDVLNLFDFPDPNQATGARAVTTVPTQALFLLNSPFLKEQSKLAAQAVLEQEATDAERVAEFLVRALGRRPSAEQTERALGFIESMSQELGREAAWARWCHTVFVSNEFLFRS